MPSEDRTHTALEAIRPRLEQFLSALAVTSEEVRGLLSGSGESGEDQSVALGKFAAGHVDVERFSRFTRQSARVDGSAEAPIRAAQGVLDRLLKEGDELFILKLPEGANLSELVDHRLSVIGLAFAAAHVVDLAKRGVYREDEHAGLLEGLAWSEWSQAERALAPGLVVELSGHDFVPAHVAGYLDSGMKFLFVVEGDAPAAAMSRLVTPGVYVQQTNDDTALEPFTNCEGTAAAALLPEGCVEFVHDPGAGDTPFERFTTLELPREIRKRPIGGISVSQQAEDLALLESLAVLSAPGGDAAADPAGKLSAWLINQTNLVSEG